MLVMHIGKWSWRMSPPPGMKMGQTFTAHCLLPTAHYFHDKWQPEIGFEFGRQFLDDRLDSIVANLTLMTWFAALESGPVQMGFHPFASLYFQPLDQLPDNFHCCIRIMIQQCFLHLHPVMFRNCQNHPRISFVFSG
jgi:hypothetical protein